MVRRIALAAAVLLIAAPVFAQGWNGDDDTSWDDDYAPPPPDEGPTFDDFRNDSELSWAGEWIDTPEYGTVWRPTHVDSDWRPYSYGHWSYTDYGWAWVSDEPFGWATYHYGRWAYADYQGWIWVPGRVWAPAWVSWRWGDGAVGWCPLGPRGFVYERPQRWVFVETRYIMEPVRHHTMPIELAQPWFHRAHAGPVQVGPHAGPPRHVVERAVGREVRPQPVVDASSPRAVAPSSGAVVVYRPRGGGRPVARTPGDGGPKVWFGGVPSQGIVDRHRRGQGDGGPVQSPHPGGPRAGPIGQEDGPRGSQGGGPRAVQGGQEGGRGQGTPHAVQGGGPIQSPHPGGPRGGADAGPRGGPSPHAVPGGQRSSGDPAPEPSPRPQGDEGGRPHVRH